MTDTKHKICTAYNAVVVGRRIRSGIEDIGMNLSDFADLLNIHESTVRSWINGKTVPALDKAVQMADLFKWPMDFLVVRESPMMVGVKTAAECGFVECDQQQSSPVEKAAE